MATVVVYNKDRMQEIEDTTVISGSVNGMGNLILTQRNGIEIDAGNIRGPQGLQGIQGVQGLHGTPGGTSVQRDALFGVPTTDAQKANLANKAAVWYNVATGILETYYAPNTIPGLTVPAMAVATAGWYPIEYFDQMSLGLIDTKKTTSSFTGIGGGSFTVTDIIPVSLVIDRWYRVEYQVTHVSGAGSDLPISLVLRSSATSDSTATGTDLDDSIAVYTAMVSGRGKTDLAVYTFKAAATGLVNLKMCVIRAAGSATFDFGNRRISVYDQGK